MNRPLTLTVEQAAELLGVGRSTAYELARSGDLACIRLRRRIVVPVAHLAERLGVEREVVWDALGEDAVPPRGPRRAAQSKPAPASQPPRSAAETPSLF